MNSKISKNLAIALVATSVFALSLAAHAEDDFAKKHPRRARVNKREKNQQKQINEGEASGKLTQQQANHIEQQEGATKAQERRDIRQNEREGKGDTLTKQQQNQLNRRENRTEGEIKHDEKMNSNAGGTAPAPAAPAPATGQ